MDPTKMSEEDLLNMSPEDFKKFDLSQLSNADPATPAATEENEDPGTPPGTSQEEDTEDTSDDDAQDDNPGAEEEVDPTPGNQEQQPGTPDEDTQDDDPSKTTTDTKDDSKEPKGKEADPAAPTQAHKDFFDKVTASFRANGRDYQINNPDDIIDLMQKGLNYNLRMAQVKPAMNLMRTLKDNGLESPEELAFLIDLHKRKPEAIAKLVQEAGIDQYDLTPEKASTYVPTEIPDNSAQAELEIMAKEYEGDEDFSKVVVDVAQEWDEQSRNVIGSNPHLIRMLVQHRKSGMYDQIVSVMMQEKALGRLNGPMLQVYDNIGRALFANTSNPQGESNQVAQPSNVQQQSQTPAPSQQPAARQNSDLDKRRKAAAPSRSTQSSGTTVNLTEQDIMNMPYEELQKINFNVLPK